MVFVYTLLNPYIYVILDKSLKGFNIIQIYSSLLNPDIYVILDKLVEIKA